MVKQKFPSFSDVLNRSRSPRETLAKMRVHLHSLGITRVGELTGLDHIGLPVAMAVRPNSRSLSVSLGKGPDKESALISAVMEATETAVAESLPRNLIWGSQAEVEQLYGPTIDLDLVARCHPLRFDRNEDTAWAQTQELRSGKIYYVPWSLIGLDHRRSPKGFHDAFYVTSDGLASGNNTEEALFHGICELIERDGLSNIQFAGHEELARREVLVSGQEDPLLPEILSSIESAGLEVRLFRCDDDSVYPVFLALLDARHVDGYRIDRKSSLCGGTGCHPSTGRAIVQAITEAAQARLALVAGARDDILSRQYGNDGGPVLPEQSIYPIECKPPAEFDTHNPNTNIVELLSRVGVEQIYAYEFDCRQLDVSVVRVVATNLQVPLHGDRVQITPRGYEHLQGIAA